MGVVLLYVPHVWRMCLVHSIVIAIFSLSAVLYIEVFIGFRVCIDHALTGGVLSPICCEMLRVKVGIEFQKTEPQRYGSRGTTVVHLRSLFCGRR